VNELAINATETIGPTLNAPDGLWQASGFVRGDWPVHFGADSPSGVCSESAALNGQPIPGTTGSTANPTVWHQCAAPEFWATIHTFGYGEGPVPLTLSVRDAAGVPASATKTVYIDNQQPTISLSGPTDAPSTAGTQYINVSGRAGPSGVRGLSCSQDGGPYTLYGGSRTQVPVQGVGQHTVTCSAANNAVDRGGNVNWSLPGSWTISIRQPTAVAISFGARLLDGLHCRRTHERVKVPPRWAIVHRHGKAVKVKRAARTKVVSVTRCHPTVRRVRTRVRVNGHWHWRWVRQIRLPHVIQRSTWRAKFGATTTAVGWLGRTDGVALGGQPVRIMTAPDNGRNVFTQAATTTTAPDGSWSAKLPRGPSRLVQAIYDGTNTVEPSSSGQIRVIVPASVKLLKVSPRHVAWGGTVHIVGQLQGGYLPPAGALVRLRIGFGSAYTTYGVQEHVTGNGRFSTTYTFGAGVSGVRRRYWFQVASLPVGDYPYAPANSRKITVTVG
jgi:hypothetical protein